MPFGWVIRFTLSGISKASFIFHFAVLVYGKKCYEAPLIFKIVFTVVSIIFWVRGLRMLRNLFKPLQMDSQYPTI